MMGDRWCGFGVGVVYEGAIAEDAEALRRRVRDRFGVACVGD